MLMNGREYGSNSIATQVHLPRLDWLMRLLDLGDLHVDQCCCCFMAGRGSPAFSCLSFRSCTKCGSSF